MILLKVSAISKRQGHDVMVRNIHFEQQHLQKIAIAGASGSGKTTLLKILAGLIQPDEGEVILENKRVKGPHEKLVPGHPQIAYLSQHFELRNNYRIAEILEYANTLLPGKAEALYEVCRISHLLQRKTDALSGGEKQRIALARLLTTSPKLLLLDEPFSNLDLIHKKILKAVIRDISEILQITCTLASHDPGDILPWADTILIMKEGQIIQQGSPEEIYQSPINAYAAELFGTCNVIRDAQIKSMLGIQDNTTDNKPVFIRPEALTIGDNNNAHTLKGKVNAVYFGGSYYEVDLLYSDSKITVRTEKAPPAVGDIAYLSLKTGKSSRY